MKSNPNTLNGEKINFSAGYGMLPAVHQTKIRDSIMEQCGWKSLMTFHNKRKGITRIRPVEIEVIERHFAVCDIDPWTGAKITDHVAY